MTVYWLVALFERERCYKSSSPTEYQIVKACKKMKEEKFFNTVYRSNKTKITCLHFLETSKIWICCKNYNY
jgi:hypothetical protein